MIATLHHAPLALPATWEQRYMLGRLLGKGGYAYVYEARDLSTRSVALKLLRPDPPHAKRPLADHLRCARAHFQQEAAILQALAERGVTSVPQLYESEENALAMEYISGISLFDLAMHRMSHRDLAQIGLQVCSLLASLHQGDDPIVFCDLTPDNILVQLDGTFRLIDCGLARSMSRGAAVSLRGMGTPAYAAPEIYTGRERDAIVEPRTDVYSLGALLYLHLIRQGVEPRILTTVQLRSSLTHARVPRPFVRLIIQMLHPEAGERPGVSEVVHTLTTILPMLSDHPVQR